jgi:hypothetical protein
VAGLQELVLAVGIECFAEEGAPHKVFKQIGFKAAERQAWIGVAPRKVLTDNFSYMDTQTGQPVNLFVLAELVLCWQCGAQAATAAE